MVVKAKVFVKGSVKDYHQDHVFTSTGVHFCWRPLTGTAISDSAQGIGLVFEAAQQELEVAHLAQLDVGREAHAHL